MHHKELKRDFWQHHISIVFLNFECFEWNALYNPVVLGKSLSTKIAWRGVGVCISSQVMPPTARTVCRQENALSTLCSSFGSEFLGCPVFSLWYFPFYCTARMDYASAINSLFMKERTLWELSVMSSAYQWIIMNVCHSVELLWSAKDTALYIFFLWKNVLRFFFFFFLNSNSWVDMREVFVSLCVEKCLSK